MAEDVSLRLLAESLARLQKSFANLPEVQESLPSLPEQAAMEAVLAGVAERMADNFPYFHPLYAGQMLKPPHPVARAAYAMSMWLNPNNHARDGGRASSRMEMEAVQELAAMFGWAEPPDKTDALETNASDRAEPLGVEPLDNAEHSQSADPAPHAAPTFLGHLTSGGTFANLEALWVTGQLAPGKRVVASSQAHYTHSRISQVLGLPFATVAADARGRMDLRALEQELQAGDVGTVVVTLGTTATGAVDPLADVLALRERYPFRVHVDAAYGGYFALASNLQPDARRAFDAIGQADSVVVDPHKHGLQPYGCGCILFRDPAVGRFYKHDSPYTYFTSADLHLGEISLECSRAGAAAVALWATQQLLPLTPGGQFARDLSECRNAALELVRHLADDRRFILPFAPELDIVVWAVRAPDAVVSSELAQRVFDLAAERDLHLALVKLPVRFFPAGTWAGAGEADSVTCLRSVLMKPEHREWIDAIWWRLSMSARAATGVAAPDAASPDLAARDTRM